MMALRGAPFTQFVTMRIHPGNLKRSRLVAALCVVALACGFVLFKARPRPAWGGPKPKVVLGAGTQQDADAAIAVAEKFLWAWDQREYARASELVDERVREQFAEKMKKRPIELKSIDDIRLFKPREWMLARVHASVAPSPDRKDLQTQGIAIDMVYFNKKWWVTVL